jgi:hypothetical protein
VAIQRRFYLKLGLPSVGDEASEFVLKVQGYSGDAGMILYYQRCKQAIETGVNLIETKLG